MVSIRKYLDLKGADSSDSSEPEVPAVATLCARLMEQIAEHALTDQTKEDDRAEFVRAQTVVEKRALSGNVPRVERAVRAVLRSHAATTREAAQSTAAETHRIVSVLNSALVALTGGSKRSEVRLQRIQESLERSALIRDEEGLRKSLADATRLIREERVSEQEHASRDIAALRAEIVNVRQHVAADPLSRMGGRGEAVRHLAGCLGRGVLEKALYAAAFSIDGMSSLTGRYGTIPVDEVLFQIVREKAEPVARKYTAFRWSPSSVVSFFEGPDDYSSLKAELTILCRDPVHYNLLLGNRTAVLRINLSHMLVPVTTLERTQTELDQFSGTDRLARA